VKKFPTQLQSFFIGLISILCCYHGDPFAYFVPTAIAHRLEHTFTTNPLEFDEVKFYEMNSHR